MHKRVFLLILMMSWGSSLFAVTASDEEQKLYRLINEYRAENGLSAIPFSVSLTEVAQAHVRDLDANPPSGSCNMHSWSANGNWTSCCYTPDHAQAQCMWNKPKEIAGYPGSGYENSYMHSGSATAEGALAGWKTTPGHNTVILNQSIWADNTWQALGVGIYKQYAVIWFGSEVDPKGTISTGDTTTKPTEPTTQPTSTARLINISTRAKVSSGQDAAIAGFVLSGSGSKRVLIKALGASMQDAGVATQLDPSIDLFDMRNTSAPTHSNRAWGNDSRANDVPQHLRPPRSQESAILYDLSAGAYTAIVNPEQNSGDVGLVSVDEISGDDSLKLINISTRALVDSGQNNAIAGFVIQGEGTLKVLIKAAGQSLRDAGINTSLDPKLTLVDMQTRATLAENDDWGSHPRLSEVPSAVRPTHSQDAMLVMDLSAGAYTALVSPMGVSGVGLVSVDLLQ